MKLFWSKENYVKFSILLLIIFAAIIAIATIIEEIFDTPTAKLLIYNAKWFEVLMILFIGIFILDLYYNKQLSFKKLPILFFHVSFIFIIIGGGITRYFGYEANMHILETESTDTIYTAEPYFQLKLSDENIEYTSEDPLYFSQLCTNNFQLAFDTPKGKLEIVYDNYIFEAFDQFKQLADEKTIKDYYDRNSNLDSPDALYINLIYQGRTYEKVIFYDNTRYIQPFNTYTIGDLCFEMTYGPKPLKLPFEIMLKDFKLSKYPGTDIPSASKSTVLLIDNRNGYKQEHLLTKNKVLDYDGYRFFQTSYDDDEKGTILSLNYDYWGTRVTYWGYFFMTLGAFLVLITRWSYFSQLDKKINKVRLKRKSLTLLIALVIGVSTFTNAQYSIQTPIKKQHADEFGHLMVQTYNGRFISVHSLASDVMHKLSGENKFEYPGKGKMDVMHIFLDMHVDPDYWKRQKLIKIKDKTIKKLIGINGTHASFNDFLNENRIYKLEDEAKATFQKDPSKQTTFEKELIKVTEKVTILNMTLNGILLRIFPVPDDKNQTWINWRDSLAFMPISESLLFINEDLSLPDFSYSNLMRSYLISTIYARETDNYTEPNKLVNYFKIIQRQVTPAELLPSPQKVQFEVYYSKFRIFNRLKYVFGIIGIVLLILALFENFSAKRNSTVQLLLKLFIGLFIMAFIVQTFGMGLRWYIGGHAPWSNGYEVLLLVAWGGIIAGLYVIRYSKIVLASTALLASVTLMVAGLSYYDPQLTNLNPVLKSYWLIIHVAIITIGYGFLALSFIIGLLNLFFFIFKPVRKEELFSLVIEELTLINVKLITIGMFLTAIGTFIGCVWANESWGTYWSWNAKQTWSLIIILVYGVILHFRLIPKLKSYIVFNVGAIIAFGTVIMTFVGVNYYFTKGLHSYASDDPPIFPIGAWIGIGLLLLLIIAALIKQKKSPPVSDEDFSIK